ncbi:phosphotransferase enzyme family protein [Burkholderia perseverans]|uniref:phosphotransferase enzyme family protein n=1 Tax=Burkholderia perseverans TaxID=2615214 RepID=UPI001FEECA8C|nr:phosphotransferase [Burkholderia perseverans]
MNDPHRIRVTRSLLQQDDVGRLAAQRYGLAGEVRTRLWTIGDNDNYMLYHDGAPRFLRVYLASKHWGTGEADYRFELDFLLHLHAQGLPVAYPLRALDGDVLSPVPAPEGTRYLAMFSYVRGDVDPFPDGEDGEARRAGIGRHLAGVHRAGTHFTSRHARFALDAGFLLLRPIERIGTVWRPRARPRLDALLAEARERVEPALATLPAGGDGVIVGDFHGSNYHFFEGRATLFDFDLCGVGWHAHDLATWLWDARKRFGDERARALFGAMARGYESVLPLSAASRAALPALMIAREIWLAGEHCADIESLGEQRLDARYWDAFEERLARWLASLPVFDWFECA